MSSLYYIIKASEEQLASHSNLYFSLAPSFGSLTEFAELLPSLSTSSIIIAPMATTDCIVSEVCYQPASSSTFVLSTTTSPSSSEVCGLEFTGLTYYTDSVFVDSDYTATSIEMSYQLDTTTDFWLGYGIYGSVGLNPSSDMVYGLASQNSLS